MRKLRFFFLSGFSFLSLIASAQYNFKGKIIDSASREPLAGASVFCQNTTIGTATNKQGEFSLELKSGGYDLIITYTGYKIKELRINSGDLSLDNIEMVKEEKSLGEVIITSNNEVKDGWEKYGTFFVDHFVGTTPNAGKFTIENPEVLKFYYLKRSNKLRVLASEPVIMQNAALGYNLRYQLDSFVYYYNTDINTYRGYCLFTEMEGDDNLKKTWAKNRRNAYFGSKLHFMRSYYDNAVEQEGFLIEMLQDGSTTKFNRLNNLYDTAYYGALDSVGEVEIWFPRLISVSYTKSRPEKEYLEMFGLPLDVLTQNSYINLRNAVGIKENGYFYDQRDWVNQGYWGWKNIADALPYDYFPL
jgi:hypothetical protein